jgi:multidrug efflux system membrane fusion protein
MTNESSTAKRVAGRLMTIGIVLYTLIVGAISLHSVSINPRTDDAEVFANFIGIAPQVDGPIVKLYVEDNQLVHKGDLLMEIDGRPYRYALEHAKSERETLEGQIEDERRAIAAQSSGVDVAQTATRTAEANVARYAASVEEAKASVLNARAGLARAEADLNYASSNLRRIQPLLAEQFVTVDQVDQAKTLEMTRQQAVEQARSQLKVMQAAQDSAFAQYQQGKAALDQSHQQVQVSRHSVATLDPLVAQRSGRTSSIETAEYNLSNCRIYAPFDARVTNLTISEGAYAHTGQQIFTLIDTRAWWVMANFRETELKHIHPGMPADVYILAEPDRALSGTVESVGFGVTPDADVVGKLNSGLPDVQRTLNWVHLASRFPVRIRIDNPPADLVRMGTSSMVIVRASSRRPLVGNYRR